MTRVRIAAAFGLGCAGIALLWILRNATDDGPLGATPGAASATAPLVPERAPLPEAASRVVAPVSGAATLRSGRMPSEREVGGIHGIVFEQDGTPAAGVTVLVDSELGHMPDWAQAEDERGVRRETATAADGTFAVDDLPHGPYALRARAGARGGAFRSVTLAARSLATTLHLGAAEREVTIQVVGPDLQPVAGAEVVLTLASPCSAGIRSVPQPVARTSDQGLAHFRVPQPACGAALVHDHAGRNGAVSLEQITTAARLVLGAPGALRGRVRGVGAIELTGARLLLRRVEPGPGAVGQHLPAHEAAVVGDAYQFPRLTPGWYEIGWLAPGGSVLRYPEHPRPDSGITLLPVIAQVEPGKATELDLELEAGCTLRGVVRMEDGSPVAGARVEVWRRGLGWDPFSWTWHGVPMLRFDGEAWTGVPHPGQSRELRTDQEGRYGFAGLPPGYYGVTVSAPGCTFWQDFTLEIRSSEVRELSTVVAPAGAVQLAVPNTLHLGLFRADSQQPVVAFVPPADGAVTIPGLAPGTYRVLSLGAGQPQLGEFRIVAGRTTWLDLRHSGPVEIRGQVRQRGVPVAGAEVCLPGHCVRSDAQGEFTLRLPGPIAKASDSALFVTHGPGTWFVPVPRELVGAMRWQGTLHLGTDALDVQVLGANGRPAPASLELDGWRVPDEDGEAHAFSGRLAAPRGQASFDGLFAGQYELRVRFGDGAKWQQRIEVPRSGPLVVEAPPVGSVRLRLLDAAGVPLPGQIVGLLDVLPDTDFGAHTARTDAEGRALVRGLPPRTLRFGIFHWMQGSEGTELDPTPVPVAVVAGGTVAVELRMRK